MNTIIPLIIAAIAISAGFSQAAVAPLSPEELKKSATHIVAGIVEKVTSKVVPNSNGGGNTDRVFKISLRIESIEKGAGVKKGQLIVLHAWKPERRKEPFDGPQGHSNIPKQNGKVRVYVRKIDGLYRVIHPNGIFPFKTQLNSSAAP